MTTKQLAGKIYRYLRQNGDFALVRDLHRVFGYEISAALDLLAYEQRKVLLTRGVAASVEVW